MKREVFARKSSEMDDKILQKMTDNFQAMHELFKLFLKILVGNFYNESSVIYNLV